MFNKASLASSSVRMKKSLRRSVCLSVCQVILSVESMWHDSSRKGGEPFSLAGSKCTSLSALQEELEKWKDVTFPNAAEVRWPISYTQIYSTERQWSTASGFGFGYEVYQDDHMTNVERLKWQIKWQVKLHLPQGFQVNEDPKH